MTFRFFLGALARTVAAVAFVYLLFPLPPFLLVHALRWLPTSVDPWFMVFALQVVFFLAAALVLRVPLAALSVAGGPANAAGLRAVFWLLFGEVLLAVLGAVTALSAAESGAVGFTVSEGLRSFTRELPRSGITGAALRDVILVPVFEEFVFRAFLLGVLLKPLRPWLALLVSTALFASVHSSWLPAVFGGIVYGLLYLRYGNVWLCILAHAANNLLVAAGVPMLVAYLHEIGVFHGLQGNLLILQLTWVAVVLACFAMFISCLLRRDEGSPLLLPRSS